LRDALVVVPARWGSQRFPGKVLVSLGGSPLVLHACRIAERAQRVADVIVATDDERVAEHVRGAGFEARMTSAEHPSGSDRIAEVLRGREEELVVGLQADEPFLRPDDLDRLVAALANEAEGVAEAPGLATLAAPLEELDDFLDPNVVKVVADGAGRALYFSRSPIPFPRAASGPLAARPETVPAGALRHVGVYGWRREALFAFCALPPSPLERREGLEQLRALEAGLSIALVTIDEAPLGIDTPEDLRRAEARLAAGPSGATRNDS
jgi:3-deoxy-manno-octulosonate cytidylyltransferase (CMP-KDO synthetase)